MYTEFFGLQKLPFNLTPDPAFLFLPAKHRESLAGLTYTVLDRKGFVVLTGDAGTGKTTLLSSALDRLPSDRVHSSIILNPTLTPAEFLESVMLDFDIPNVPASKAQRIWMLQEFLARAFYQDKIALLVIDEAHKLSVEVIEEIRLLGNFENADNKLLQIVLLGQSELDDLLNRQDLRQFKQRIALRLYIDPLTGSQVEEYIGFRWAKAGSKDFPPFTPDAVRGIGLWSGGIPRLVNSLCDSALLMAYAEGSRSVGLNYVRDAASNLALLEDAVPPRSAPQVVAAPTMPKYNPGLTVVVPDAQEPPPDPDGIPKMLPYCLSKSNSSLLKRLAERFGLPR